MLLPINYNLNDTILSNALWNKDIDTIHVHADYLVIIIANTFIKDESKRFQLISSINDNKSKDNNSNSLNNQLSDKLKIVNYKIYELVVDSDNLSRS